MLSRKRKLQKKSRRKTKKHKKPRKIRRKKTRKYKRKKTRRRRKKMKGGWMKKCSQYKNCNDCLNESKEEKNCHWYTGTDPDKFIPGKRCQSYEKLAKPRKDDKFKYIVDLATKLEQESAEKYRGDTIDRSKSLHELMPKAMNYYGWKNKGPCENGQITLENLDCILNPRYCELENKIIKSNDDYQYKRICQDQNSINSAVSNILSKNQKFDSTVNENIRYYIPRWLADIIIHKIKTDTDVTKRLPKIRDEIQKYCRNNEYKK